MHIAKARLGKTRLSSYYDRIDGIDFLRHQHREIDALFGGLVRTSLAREKRRLLAEVADLIAVHMVLEERIFYPGVYPLAGSALDHRAVVVAVEDHFDLKRDLVELVATDVEAARFDATATALAQQVRAHAVEEDRALSRLRRRLAPARLRRLEYDMRVLEFQLRTDAEPRHLFTADAAPAAMA